MTTLNFDRTQSIDLQNIGGILEYSTGKCSNLYIGFPVPASSSLPYVTYIQYSGALGIIRITVNMPYPWSAGVGCLSNNYDIPGKDDFDYCKIKLDIETECLPPGEITKVHAFSCLPIEPTQPLVWQIEPVEGYDVKATITSDGGLGETATITDAEGKGYVLITVTNPSFSDCKKEKKLYIGCEICDGDEDSGGVCLLPGGAFWGEPHVATRFGLGRTKQGKSAGGIYLPGGTCDPLNVTPQILEVDSFRDDAEIVMDSGVLRQVVAPESFVDITVIDTLSYSISFYQPEEMGTKVDGIYQVMPGATPVVTWTFEDGDGLPAVCERLRITESKDGNNRIHEYTWNDTENTWRLSKGNGLQVISREEENLGGNRVVTETIKDDSDNVASKVRTTYADITYNSQTSEEIIEIVEDPDGDALTTTRDWYQDPCALGSCGKLKSQINPDGSWVKYEYDSLGRKILEIRAWLDAPISSSAGSARAIYYEYSAQHVDDSQAAEDARLPRKITEEILGNETATTFYVYTNNGDGSRTEVVERASTPGAAYGASGNLRTNTEFYPFNDSSADSWRIKSVTHPDGTRDAYTYEYGTQLTILGQVVSSLFASIRIFPPDTGSWVESRGFARPLPGPFFIKSEFPGDVC